MEILVRNEKDAGMLPIGLGHEPKGPIFKH